MRKMLCSLAFACVLGFALPVKAADSAQAIESLLPKTTVGFISISHLDRLWAVLPELPLLQNWPADLLQDDQSESLKSSRNLEHSSVQGLMNPLEILNDQRDLLNQLASMVGFKTWEEFLGTMGSEITLAGIIDSKGAPHLVTFFHLPEGSSSGVFQRIEGLAEATKTGTAPFKVLMDPSKSSESSKFIIQLGNQKRAFGMLLKDEGLNREYLVIEPSKSLKSSFNSIQRLAALSLKDRAGEVLAADEDYNHALEAVTVSGEDLDNTVRAYINVSAIMEGPLGVVVNMTMPEYESLIHHAGSFLATLDLEEGAILNAYMVRKDRLFDAEKGVHPFLGFMFNPQIFLGVATHFAERAQEAFKAAEYTPSHEALKDSSQEEARKALEYAEKEVNLKNASDEMNQNLEQMKMVAEQFKKLGIRSVDFSAAHISLERGDVLHSRFAWGLDKLTVDE